MNYILDLKPHIGSERTLIITGGDHNDEREGTSNSGVFVFTTPQGMLFRYDPQQHETLLHHVCEKECSQIIYVAPTQRSFLEHLENKDSPGSLHRAVKYHLDVLLREHTDSPIPYSIRQQILLELYAIEQCKLLMEYFFIRKKIDQRDLKLKGLVVQLNSEQLKTIFFNGIVYNNLLTMN